MTTTANAFFTVDETLKKLTDAGLADAGLTPKPEVTVGPLDRDEDGPRLNWFLYGINPHPSFRNMEHPLTGPANRRGAPPLAVELHYLLTAYGAPPTTTGDGEQIIHVALAAVMRRFTESAIVGLGSPFLPTTPAPQLVEPLRFTLEPLDLENASKIWTAATRPMRLSVVYRVSLVVVEQQLRSPLGPPVTTPRVVVSPSLSPRLGTPEPARIGGDEITTLAVAGTVTGLRHLLASAPGDPPGAPADGWPMTVVSEEAGRVRLRLPRHDLVAGARRLDVVSLVEGMPAGRDSVTLTVAPTVTVPPGPVAAGTPLTLTTAHTGADTEAFLDGVPLPTSGITRTSVTVTVPPGPPGEHGITLRSAHVAGSATPLQVTP
ncbi:Pvc16 family protein [Geodermatophilus sp. SYSU D00691]